MNILSMVGIYLTILFFAIFIIFGLINRSKKQDGEAIRKPDECCGAHAICQKLNKAKKNTAKARIANEIVYYDDEELDVFAGRFPDSYGDDEIALFASIFHTLQENDIAGWLESLQFRNIKLPEKLREEMEKNGYNSF